MVKSVVFTSLALGLACLSSTARAEEYPRFFSCYNLAPNESDWEYKIQVYMESGNLQNMTGQYGLDGQPIPGNLMYLRGPLDCSFVDGNIDCNYKDEKVRVQVDLQKRVPVEEKVIIDYFFAIPRPAGTKVTEYRGSIKTSHGTWVLHCDAYCE